MPEIAQDKKIHSLLEITASIQRGIEKHFVRAYWIKVELNKLNYYSQSGHCYPELVEKQDGKVVAQIKGMIWKDHYARINANFMRIVKESLKDGIKILIHAEVKFTPVYGISLNIIDIDPNFTLGDIEKEKQETIAELHKKQLFDKNKKTHLPLLPQRIAIISVESSKGYADFMQLLLHNAYDYHFKTKLFPALLQGEQAVPSILNQLNNLEKIKENFDVVAIIRGGGGDVGLSCYNQFRLAEAVTKFPLPVITGIGHATNFTVVEMVAYYNAITPSKLAEYLIQKFHNFAIPLEESEQLIVQQSMNIIKNYQRELQTVVKNFTMATKLLFNTNNLELKQLCRDIPNNSYRHLSNQLTKLKQTLVNMTNTSSAQLKQATTAVDNTQIQLQKALKTHQEKLQNQINHWGQIIQLADPMNIVEMGYAIVEKEGTIIKTIKEVNQNDEIDIQMKDGVIKSKVISLTPKRPAH
ncbi:MAG: exodeoxyribonuclease VII large subunit [Phycisphaerales bacterium]|nr:exodeoxyribonuclease VII large subunit [Phycisphaerales bacterium]